MRRRASIRLSRPARRTRASEALAARHALNGRARHRAALAWVHAELRRVVPCSCLLALVCEEIILTLVGPLLKVK